MPDDMRDKISRRDFVKTSVAFIGGIAVAKNAVAQNGAASAAPAPASVVGANQRLNIALVGAGAQGNNVLNYISKMAQEQNVNIIAVCDVFQKAARQTAAKHGIGESGIYFDHRKLLENKDIDIVVVATPDHRHSEVTVNALESGKHVYCEKPMTRSWEEAIYVQKAAKGTDKLIQVGAQGCSESKYHKAAQIIRNDGIGRVVWAQGSFCRNNPNGEWNTIKIDPDANPRTLDWNQWLGNAPKIDWNPERCFRWRKYWDYSTGIIGMLWPHRLHPLLLAMAMDEYPRRVSCIGANICETDTGVAPRREIADTHLLTVEFPSGAQMVIAGSTVNEQGLNDVIRGQKATVYFGGDKIEVRPERPFADETEALDIPINEPSMSIAEHNKNLWYCIRNGGTPNCTIDNAIIVQAILVMAERSHRESKMMHFDAKTMKIS